MQRLIKFVFVLAVCVFAVCAAGLAMAQVHGSNATQAYAPHGVSYNLSCPIGRAGAAATIYELSIPSAGICDTRGLPNSVNCFSNASGPTGSLDYAAANCRTGCGIVRGGGRCVVRPRSVG